MKYYFTIVTLILFLFCQDSFGQDYHEFSINVSGIRDQQYKPAYEYIIDGKFGLFLMSSFDLSDEELTDFSISTGTTVEARFSAKRFNPVFAGHYYISKKRNGAGFFIGPSIAFEILLRRDENYADAWVNHFPNLASDPRFQVPSDISKTSGLLTVIPGINLGYKFIIKEHFIVELFGFMTCSTRYEDVEFIKSGGCDFAMDLRIGYRF